MAAVFGGYGVKNDPKPNPQKPNNAEPPKYGAVGIGYQPSNIQKPNYHYQ